jgi:hypothetical protein
LSSNVVNAFTKSIAGTVSSAAALCLHHWHDNILLTAADGFDVVAHGGSVRTLTNAVSGCPLPSPTRTPTSHGPAASLHMAAELARPVPDGAIKVLARNEALPVAPVVCDE